MAEDIKELIEKIQQEGVEAAEEKARAIEEQAAAEAKAIVAKAKAEAEKSLLDAKGAILKMEESSRVALKQAGRDLILGLKKEIRDMLDRLIGISLRQALTAEEMAKIISVLIKEHKAKEPSGDILISLPKDDLVKIEKSFLAGLNEQAKKGITLKPSEEITGGFTISYDNGKSHYDFTDKALAEYLGFYLRPRLKEILKG